MNNLQLATTLVAPTGTGLLYTAFEQGGDIAAYVNGSGATRSRIALKRVQAKPTPTYPGVERLNFKRTVYLTVNSIEYPVVLDINTSIPVVIALADRTAFFTHAALMARDPIFQSAIETGAIPT
jgi:hypothetical protein